MTLDRYTMYQHPCHDELPTITSPLDSLQSNMNWVSILLLLIDVSFSHRHRLTSLTCGLLLVSPLLILLLSLLLFLFQSFLLFLFPFCLYLSLSFPFVFSLPFTEQYEEITHFQLTILTTLAFARFSTLDMIGWVESPTDLGGILCSIAKQYFEVRTSNVLRL